MKIIIGKRCNLLVTDHHCDNVTGRASSVACVTCQQTKGVTISRKCETLARTIHVKCEEWELYNENELISHKKKLERMLKVK